MARTVYLKTPLTEEEVRGLQLDDVVYLTGDAYTMMYIDHFTRLTGMIKAGEPLPMELKGNVIYIPAQFFAVRRTAHTTSGPLEPPPARNLTPIRLSLSVFRVSGP